MLNRFIDLFQRFREILAVVNSPGFDFCFAEVSHHGADVSHHSHQIGIVAQLIEVDRKCSKHLLPFS